jgi:NNP family nitrate/nitrite transporter-like MFS transporter
MFTTKKAQATSVLTANTFAFTSCFAVWVMFSIIGIPIKDLLDLSETQFGLLVATPILTGSLARLPIGMLTDRMGGRTVYLFLMLAIIVPLWLIGEATKYWQFLFLGLFIGIAGAAFSVGIAYTSKWFDDDKQGFAMGIFGSGNAGAAVTKFIAPSLVLAYGWQMVPRVYAVSMIVVVIIYWIFTYEDPSHRISARTTIKDQLSMLSDPKIWKYMQYYSLVFGGFVAISLWITKYYINEYGFDLRTAAFLATIFVLPSGVIRALGGWFSDKYGAYKVTWWVMWISLGCLFFMSYPQTALIIKTTTGEAMFDISLNVWVFTALLFVLGLAWGFGKASVFKFLSDEYHDNIGTASGLVGLAGGLGGFLLPIMFGVIIDYTHINSAIFMLLYGATGVSLIWMHYTFSKEEEERHIQQANDIVLEEYKEAHGDEALISARAILEQADLIEELTQRYNNFKNKHKSFK